MMAPGTVTTLPAPHTWQAGKPGLTTGGATGGIVIGRVGLAVVGTVGATVVRTVGATVVGTIGAAVVGAKVPTSQTQLARNEEMSGQ
jgi:hypothetical protein